MNFTKFIVLSHHEHQSVSLFRTSSFTRNFATNGNKQTEKSKVEEPNTAEAQKLSLLQRFKQMYRDYWYVLVPVHLITSLGWFAGFYYLAKRYEISEVNYSRKEETSEFKWMAYFQTLLSTQNIACVNT